MLTAPASQTRPGSKLRSARALARPSPQAVAGLLVLAALSGGGAPSAHAGLVASQVINFDIQSGQLTASCSAGQFEFACSATGAPSTASRFSFFNKFDTNLGVLTGVQVQLASQATQSLSFQLSGGANSSSSTVSGSATLALALPGLGSPGISPRSATLTAQGGGSNTAQPGSFNFTTSIVDLAPYVLGSGQVLMTRAIEEARASVSLADSFFLAENTLTGRYDVNWVGQTTLRYEYLLHAAPAFDARGATTLDVDFGEWFVGQDAGTQAREILNLLGGHRNGLDLDAISVLDGSSPFSADLGLFTGLGAGGTQGFSLGFDTRTAGVFNDQIRLSLSDANVGFEGTWRQHELTINLRGTVLETPTQAVPEPHGLALVGAALLGVTLTSRRRPYCLPGGADKR